MTLVAGLGKIAEQAVTDESYQIGRARVTEGVAGQDLDGLGRAPAGGSDDVEQHVRYDAPVEVESDLPQEEEREAAIDVDVGDHHPDRQEDGADEYPAGTDHRVSSRELGLELSGEDHAKRHPDNPRQHRHNSEHELHFVLRDASVLLSHGLEAVLDEVRPPPAESPGTEGDAGEGESGEDEALVLGETDDVLLK